MKTYNVDYFIDKFEAIPEDKWFVGNYTDPDDDDRHCALGHCRMGIEDCHLERILGRIGAIGSFKEGNYVFFNSARINDGKHPAYQQATPKQRVLAALRHIQKLEQSNAVETKIVEPEPQKQAERVVYVTVDAEVRELQKKELTVN